MIIKDKRVLLVFKLLILAACLYYLFVCISKLEHTQLKPVYFICALGTGVLYFLGTFLMVMSWRLILIFVCKFNIPFVDLCIVYFQSAMAKYIPSNVMHYAARHYMCGQLGISQKNVLLSNIMEITLILMAAIVLISAFIFSGVVALPEILAQNESLVQKLTLVFVVGALITSGVLIWRKTKTIRSSGSLHISKFIAAYVLYLVFLPLTGLVLCFLFWVIDSNAIDSWQKVIVVVFGYVTSWTIGFVTPGAPGGLGVREAVMVAILGPHIGPELAVLGAVLFRISSVFGETLGYLFAKYLRFRKVKQ